jgi:hypothetical protein
MNIFYEWMKVDFCRYLVLHTLEEHREAGSFNDGKVIQLKTEQARGGNPSRRR